MQQSKTLTALKVRWRGTERQGRDCRLLNHDLYTLLKLQTSPRHASTPRSIRSRALVLMDGQKALR